jgi:hypothetical protein
VIEKNNQSTDSNESTDDSVKITVRTLENNKWVAPKLADIGFQRLSDWALTTKSAMIIKMELYDDVVFFCANCPKVFSILRSMGSIAFPVEALKLLGKLTPGEMVEAGLTINNSPIIQFKKQ